MGNGIINYVAEDSSFSVKMNARFQTLFSSDYTIDGENRFVEDEIYFAIRRARLKFKGFAYSPALTYKIEVGLANDDIDGRSEFTNHAPLLLIDAIAKLNFYRNFELWVGQTKLPGNRERLVSSGSLQFVDRSLLNSHFNIGRETGFQLHHHFQLGDNFILREAFALSMGEGRNITTGNIGGLNWTARAEILPFGEFKNKGAYVGADVFKEVKPKLALAFSYNYNDNAVKTESNSGDYMLTDYGYFETDIKTIFVDMMFKYRGLSLMAEYAKRESLHLHAVHYDGTQTGAVINACQALNIQTGYIFKNNYELALRYTTVDFEALPVFAQEEYTLGISKYILDHQLKVQADASYGEFAEMDNSFRYRLQFELQL